MTTYCITFKVLEPYQIGGISLLRWSKTKIKAFKTETERDDFHSKIIKKRKYKIVP